METLSEALELDATLTDKIHKIQNEIDNFQWGKNRTGLPTWSELQSQIKELGNMRSQNYEVIAGLSHNNIILSYRKRKELARILRHEKNNPKST
jgi:hypothetical protein